MVDEQRDEFERALKPVRATLVVLARRLVGPSGASEAEDVLQSALVAAWARFREGERVESFRAWITRFLVNESRNAVRRRSRRAERESALDAEGEADPSFADAVEALERELSYEAFRTDPRALLECLDASLERALASLSEGERTALVLRAVGDLDYKEIAEACDVPIGTVMSRIFRAREKLRVQLRAGRHPARGQEGKP